MTPALGTAQNGLAAAGKRFGLAATSLVALSAASVQAADLQTRTAVPPAARGQGGEAGYGRRPPLAGGLLTLLQQAGQPHGRDRSGAAPTVERAVVHSRQALRAFEANLRIFQAAGAQLGETLDLVA